MKNIFCVLLVTMSSLAVAARGEEPPCLPVAIEITSFVVDASKKMAEEVNKLQNFDPNGSGRYGVFLPINAIFNEVKPELGLQVTFYFSNGAAMTIKSKQTCEGDVNTQLIKLVLPRSGVSDQPGVELID